MMRTILVTVGTSLLTNASQRLCKPPEGMSDAEILNYLRTTEPQRACAETNSLSRILREGDRVVSLHSDTPEGERCARLLKNHYEHQGYEAETQRIPDLNYKESRFKMRGLRSLVSTMIERIQREREQGRKVLINATGGFKAEIAYAVLVGLLFDLRVVYIHERFGDIIEMPPVPIDWDYSLFADNEDLLEWVESELRSSGEVERELRGRPAELRMLLTEEEDYTLLSPTGETFYQAFKQRILELEGIQVLLSDRALRSYQQMENEQEQAQVLSYLRKLKLPEWRLRNSEQPATTDLLVTPRGHINLRILYYVDDEGVKVCEILNHDEYERLLQRVVSRRSYRNFQPLV